VPAGLEDKLGGLQVGRPRHIGVDLTRCVADDRGEMDDRLGTTERPREIRDAADVAPDDLEPFLAGQIAEP